jgi:histidine triad (HIT) family protein
MDCIFCKIAGGEIPAKLLHEDERAIAFADIAPQAPTHFLVVPKEHVESLGHTARKDAPLLGHLLAVVAELAAKRGLEGGYRTVINSGDDGGQTVGHLHIHVLGGRQMHWPPG